MRAIRRFVWQGHVGGSLPKPTVLVGTHPLLRSLTSKKPVKKYGASVQKTTAKTIILNGKPKRVYRIYGLVNVLHSSQAYPAEFCDHVAAEAARINSKALIRMRRGVM